ncbi:MAG: antibiotic biosynthesis monooxygenase [Devosia nanyangense]|uniref:Antibiotic biosynthesis monooxygenase n=1 Tax=Devosia nanyangense TaxID=1228055 RepID=A0A933L2W7_9HYPH|nr:antibiotic biosynthesis monooxygenase [Devosia nanyangense]
MRYVIGHFSVQPGTRDEFMAKTKDYIDASRADDGCVYFDIALMTDNPDGLVMVECWRDQAAHKAHQASTYASAFQPTGAAFIVNGAFQEMNVENADSVVF